ncbi:MAG TPA: DUF1493 family protein [Panacibacter sp.]|nr:DUF1493 family protein [Panacibacter sp.]HNP44060.1 DUF1493 family protein [Panacibacter sp.]
MSDDELLNAIKEFTQEQAGRYPKDVKESSCLEKHLGIYGDDAMEYIIAFGKKFNVDVSKFMATEYFSAEGFDIIGAGARLFTGKKSIKKKDLLILHLIKAIKAGKLNQEIINNSKPSF